MNYEVKSNGVTIEFTAKYAEAYDCYFQAIGEKQLYKINTLGHKELMFEKVM